MVGLLASLLVNDDDAENSSTSEGTGNSEQALIQYASGDVLTIPNKAQRAPSLSSIIQAGLLPNVQTLSTTSVFTTAQLELDPHSDFSPSALIRALSIQRPNLHISVRSKRRRVHHQLTSEGWPQDLAPRFYLSP